MNAKRFMQTAHRNSGEDHPAPNSFLSEWDRIPGACLLSKLSRSTLYSHFDISGGPLRTASIRRPGAVRGIRMVHIPTLLTWLDSHAEKPNAEANSEGTSD